MKKIIGLFAFMLVLNGCDDGDLFIETIDFEDVTADNCTNNNIVYKIKDNELLLIEIPAASFINQITPENTPREIAISTTNKVIYRSYNGTITSDNICSTIPPISPIVTEEWVALSGTIQITTTAVTVPNTSLTSGNATKITKYNHYVVFKNITFDKPGDTNVLYQNYVFGNYLTDATPLPFAFDEDVAKCNLSNKVYNFSGSEALVLDLDDTFFPDAVGTQTTLIDGTNKVTYTLFTSAVDATYFCGTTTPTTPIVSQTWQGKNGVTATSGIIEVETTTFGTGFQHTIHLKKVTFSRDGSGEFYLGDDYIYGILIE